MIGTCWRKATSRMIYVKKMTLAREHFINSLAHRHNTQMGPVNFIQRKKVDISAQIINIWKSVPSVRNTIYESQCTCGMNFISPFSHWVDTTHDIRAMREGYHASLFIK